MKELDSLSYFLSAIEDDVRVTIKHIGIYAALLQCWKQWDYAHPIHVFSYEMMHLAKISSSASYHKYIKDLDDYGYIRYLSSFKRNRGSRIYIASGLLRFDSARHPAKSGCIPGCIISTAARQKPSPDFSVLNDGHAKKIL